MISSDGDIAALIGAGSHWGTIDLDGYEEAGPLTQAAILDHAAHLKHLDISYIPSFSSKDMGAILAKCERLVKFIAIDPMDPDPTMNPVMSGADFIQLDWVSTSLTVWNCLSKLAQQTQLRELKLGLLDGGQVPEHESWHQTQCLEMTLASGMDELAVLKDLKHLDVSYMLHHIGVRELEWMATHWPKLKKVDGLFKGCHSPMPGVREWIAAHQRYWVMDDDGQDMLG
ncbi:hypothetical protein BGZ81_010248 [Podila clonocystis]|nr:hypothetical protein BGZ81_010248 [Podila clonocystis]